ncbi:hypothetical protein FRB97_004393 [Tulasnella sp. 331]|nr:hypothetical protein FRB97_004393 [Tulasnella sp. 331]
MSSPSDHFDAVNDLEKGHALGFDSSFASGSPLQKASNDPLSPTFGATFSPRMSPHMSPLALIPSGQAGMMPNISCLTLASPLDLSVTHNSPTSPITLDSSSSEEDNPDGSSPHLPPDSQTTLTTTSVDLEKAKKAIDTPSSEKDINNEKATGTPEITIATLAFNSAVTPTPALAAAGAAPSSKIEASRYIKFLLWFNTYRKFFTIVVTFNLTSIIFAGVGRFPYAKTNNGAFILGNLMTAVLMRNEIFGRLLYLIWPPLCIRLAATSTLQHLGGIHSGCALSGTAWLIFRIVYLIVHATANNRAVIATGIITNLAICISVLSAFPWVRNTRHNVFERHHRFMGWFGLAFTWIFVMLSNGYEDESGVWQWDGSHVLRTQDLYFVCAMTILIGLPWACTRKVPVHVEIPSSKVAILRFDRGMQQGLLGRISRTSIMEYHAFGIISEGKHAKYHYMVAGVQGDFTRSLVENPPTHIWTREVKFAGVSNTSTLYKRGIRIATGTGIGAALSTCLQSKDWFLIWIGSDQEKTFGKTISGLIESGIEPERRILWDTKKLKRPNTMKLLKETYESWDAEVVFITSNLGGNTELMEGCKTLGMPAFGTLRWRDSKSGPVVHTPHHSTSSELCYLPQQAAVLSASLRYGIVSRSEPSTGKVLKGYIDAAGLFNGQGHGNPNAEFSPDVSAISIRACGGTAYLVWGFRNGEIGVTSAPKVMDQAKSRGWRYQRCALQNVHDGRVERLVLASDAQTFVSGGFDGKIKLWDTKTLHILWCFAPTNEGSIDPVQQLAYQSETGTLSAAFRSGVVIVWAGLMAPTDIRERITLHHSHQVIIPPPLSSSALPAMDDVTLLLYTSPKAIHVVIHGNKTKHVDRVFIAAPSETVGSTDQPRLTLPYTCIRYTEGPVGAITALKVDIANERAVIRASPTSATIVTSPLAIFASTLPDVVEKKECSFIIAGDELGCVCIWPWDKPNEAPAGATEQIGSMKRFEAHSDGGVSSIALSQLVLVTGSTRGTIMIWDSLTLELLRSISSPSPRPHHGTPWDKVEQIVVDAERDLLLVSVGSRILYWKAGKPSQPTHKRKGKKNGNGSMRPSGARYQQQLEIKRAVNESQKIMDDERTELRESHKRRATHRSTLDVMGLDELEALEYALMISRDYEEARREMEANGDAARPALHEVDQDRASNSLRRQGRPMPITIPSSSSRTGFKRSPPASSVASFGSSQHSEPDSTKVLESPRLEPEPTEAGFSASPLEGSPWIARRASRTFSHSTSNASLLLRAPSFTPSATPRTPPGPAWSHPRPLSVVIPPSSPPLPRTSGPALLSTSLVRHEGFVESADQVDDELDEDLKYAIALSLAEARSQIEQ